MPTPPFLAPAVRLVDSNGDPAGAGGSSGTGTAGSTAPTTAFYNAYKDGSGNLTGVSPTTPLPTVAAALPAGTNRSGTITTGGTAQQLAAANTSRRFLVGQNTSVGDLWFNETGGTAAVNGAGSYKIVSGQSFSVSTNQAISVIGATTGQAFTATEG